MKLLSHIGVKYIYGTTYNTCHVVLIILLIRVLGVLLPFHLYSVCAKAPLSLLSTTGTFFWPMRFFNFSPI